MVKYASKEFISRYISGSLNDMRKSIKEYIDYHDKEKSRVKSRWNRDRFDFVDDEYQKFKKSYENWNYNETYRFLVKAVSRKGAIRCIYNPNYFRRILARNNCMLDEISSLNPNFIREEGIEDKFIKAISKVKVSNKDKFFKYLISLNHILKLALIENDLYLEAFVNDDKDYDVRAAICKKGIAPRPDLIKNATKLKIYLIESGKFKMEQFLPDQDPKMREYLIDNGVGIEEFKYDSRKTVKNAYIRNGYHLDYLSNDEDVDIKLEIIKNGFLLDKFISDKDYRVRMAIACKGYGSDILYKDDDYRVRASVASSGCKLEELSHDKNKYVRQAVAYTGYNPYEMIKDPDDCVSFLAYTHIINERSDKNDEK